MRRLMTAITRWLTAGAAAIACSGCSTGPITARRIELAIGPTFANLVQLQVSWMGLPPMTRADVDVTARCRKSAAPGAPSEHAGSGEWVCTIEWHGPGRRPLRDVYDVVVSTDGCYSATVEGESLARPTLTTDDGRDVKNLLFVFEGCFDTT